MSDPTWYGACLDGASIDERGRAGARLRHLGKQERRNPTYQRGGRSAGI